MNTLQELVSNLIFDGYLKTPRLIEAFKKIDRADFVSEEYRHLAYINEPLPIGHNQTISQPLTVAFMLEFLEPKPGEKILDIGSGSGWQTALLAQIVGPEGKVLAMERILELKSMTEANLKKYSFVEKGIVKVIYENAGKGAPQSLVPKGGFDKIIAAASAENIPAIWKEQLKIGGRIVAPVGHSIVAIDKISENEFREKEYFGFAFVPLIED